MQTKFTRRTFLKLGGVALVLTVGGSVFRAFEQGIFSVGQGPAYQPWRDWRSAATPVERTLAAAILASNPHNSQPWLFRLTPTTIDMFADPGRQIGVIDPFRREMYIGLGCALENISLAAAAEGLSADIRLMPDPADSTYAAHISVAPALPRVSDLYSVIPHRHTNRGPYDPTRPIPPEIFDAFAQTLTGSDLRLFWFRDQAERAKFGDVALTAAQALITDEQQSIDSHLWWRQDWGQLQKKADGITLDAEGLNPIMNDMGKFLPDFSRQQNDQVFVNNVRDVMLATASAFGILAVRDNLDHAQHLACGRIWQRLHLFGVTQKLAMQPLNQMCERVDRERQLGLEPMIGKSVQTLLKDDRFHAIMPFRLGYPSLEAALSPRRPLNQVIM